MKRTVSILLALLMLLPTFALAQETTDPLARVAEWAAACEPMKLPLSETTETLTVFCSLSEYHAMFMDSYDESTVVKEMEKRLGIDLEFVLQPAADDGTFFNMLLASGDYPDVWIADWSTYPGGYDGAVKDGILADIDPLIKKYAVNFLTHLATSDVETYKSTVNDQNKMSIGATFNPEFILGAHNLGAIIRKDLLDAVGKTVPYTLDELTDVLRAFKEYGIEVPIAYGNSLSNYRYTDCSFLSSAFGIAYKASEYMLDENGNVFYPRMTEGFKEFCKYLNGWYKEGLIDRDLVTRTDKDALKMLYNGRTGIAFIGNWQTSEAAELGKLEDKNFEIVPLRCPRLSDPEQEIHVYGGISAGGGYGFFGISENCKNKELAIRFLDWLYTKEANELCMWGVGDLGDGTSTYYINENGSHAYGDIIIKNPDYPFETIRHKYTIEVFVRLLDEEAERAEYNTQLHMDCWREWGYKSDNSLIAKGSLTVDEDTAFSVSQTNIASYTDEMMLKFIFGEADIDQQWDTYVAYVDSLGLQENIAIKNAAYQRYLAR